MSLPGARKRPGAGRALLSTWQCAE